MPTAYLAFVVATIVLALIPGPNVTAVIGTSLAHGVGRGLLVAAGASFALAIQVVLVVAGLAPLIRSAVWIGEVLRWGGVAYLLYLAVKEWRAAKPGALVVTAAPRGAKIFGRGMLVARREQRFDGRCVPRERDQLGDVLQVEGQVRRP